MKYLSKIVFLLSSLNIQAATQSKARTESMYFIGSYDQSGNYTYQEDDYLLFKEHLLKGPHHVLNSQGEKTQVVPFDRYGNIVKDYRGEISYGPTQVGGKPASIENLGSAFSQMAASNPSAVTNIYADHAGPGFITVTSNEKLTLEEILDLERSHFKGSPLIRNLHLHCYAGAQIGPKSKSWPGDSSKLPEDTRNLDHFLNKYYPANRCSLALSHESQVGQYYGSPQFFTEKNEENGWKDALTANPKISISQLKEHVSKDPSFAKIPVSTSDIFLENIADIVCREIENRKEKKLPSGCETLLSNSFPLLNNSNFNNLLKVVENDQNQRLKKMEKEICQRESIPNIFSLNDDPTVRANDQLLEALNTFKVDYLKKRNPSLVAYAERYEKRMNDIFDNVPINRRQEAFERMQKQFPQESEAHKRYNKILFEFETNKEAKSFVNNNMYHYLYQNREKYPELTQYIQAKKIPTFEYLSAQLDVDKNVAKDHLLKKKGLSYYQNLSTSMTPLLNLPSFKKLKDQYENIKHCEDTPLN